jgi:hypothetical protein
MTLSRYFIERHRFTIDERFAGDALAIEWLEATRSTIGTEIAIYEDQVASTKTSGVRQLMLGRIYDQVAAATVAYFTGNWVGLEILARSAVEASISLLYVNASEPAIRLGEYLGTYFLQARRHLESLEPSVPNLEARARLTWREDYFRRILDLRGIDLHSTGWPASAAERLRAANLEGDYQGVYNALSNPLYGEAESIVDFVLLRGITREDPGPHTAVDPELALWIRINLYAAVYFYTRASESLAASLGLEGAERELRTIGSEVASHLRRQREQTPGVDPA